MPFTHSHLERRGRAASAAAFLFCVAFLPTTNLEARDALNGRPPGSRPLDELASQARNGCDAGATAAETGQEAPAETDKSFTSKLDRLGLKPAFAFTGELFSNLSGGLRRQAEYLDNFSLALVVDLGKLAGWRGAELHLHGLSIQGRNPSDDVGDFQTVSDIAAVPATRLYEAWIEQKLFHDRVSFLAGLYDLNSEFEFIDSASAFVNSSQAVEPSFAKSGVNGPSIFPFTALGFRAKYSPNRRLYLQSAVFDGVAGDPSNPRGTHVILREGNGILSATEAGYLFWAAGQKVRETPGAARTLRRYAKPLYDGKIALGLWFYTAKFPPLLAPQTGEAPAGIRGNRGVYVLLARTVFRDTDDAARSLAVFARFGAANPRINRIGVSTVAGLAFTGLFPGRKEDVLGIGVSGAHNGGDFLRAQSLLGVRAARSEWCWELTYQAQLSGWAAIHPDIQYVVHPGTDPAVRNALALDLRLEISL